MIHINLIKKFVTIFLTLQKENKEKNKERARESQSLLQYVTVSLMAEELI